MVNGKSDSQRIARLFATQYNDLYTSVPCNNAEFKRIVDDVNKRLAQSTCDIDCAIHVNDVKSAVMRLKMHKMTPITISVLTM